MERIVTYVKDRKLISVRECYRAFYLSYLFFIVSLWEDLSVNFKEITHWTNPSFTLLINIYLAMTHGNRVILVPKDQSIIYPIKIVN